MKFKPEDFDGFVESIKPIEPSDEKDQEAADLVKEASNYAIAAFAAQIANTKLEEWLARKPRPCPFCKSHKLTWLSCEDNRWEGSHVVRCANCGADGPESGDTEKEAIKLWNKRE